MQADPQLDEDGWRDRDCLQPRPVDPEHVFQQVWSNMEAMLGSFDRKHDEALETALHDVDAASIEHLVKLAYQTRWLRLGVADDLAWGRVMGRLRWAAHRLDGDGGRLAAAVEATTRPSSAGGWAAHFAADRERRGRERRRAELRQNRPWDRGSALDRRAVLHWLVAAFDAFNTDEIAEMVVGIREPIEGFDDDDIAALKRGHRRRFAALRRKLAGHDGGAEAEIEDDVGELDAAEAAPVARPDPGEALIARVREQVSGKAALFVSNRDDPQLKRSIEESFGLVLDWCDSSSRRLQSALNRIQQGTYDLVIAATGFLGHKDERPLGRACKQAGVPYARAYRGRTLACATAIAAAVGSK